MRQALFLSVVLLLPACNAASRADEGEAARGTAQRAFPAGAFDRIALQGSADVVVTVGGAPSIRAEGDAEAVERLEIVIENGQLRIGERDSGSDSWFGHNRRGVTVHVSLPALAKAAIGGSGDMLIDRVAGPRFEAAIGGSGDMAIGALQADDTQFTVAGSGDIRVAGRTGTTQLSLAGSGDIDAGAMESRTADISLAGSGDIRVRASETANISSMGSGDVTVAGTARCTVRKAGSGEVHCGG